jgi:hypothetical protein
MEKLTSRYGEVVPPANWFVVNSSNGASFSKPLGKSGDRPLPYDYDGDGRTDMAVWRSNTGEWIIINSPNRADKGGPMGERLEISQRRVIMTAMERPT